jgi:hypothetical protein
VSADGVVVIGGADGIAAHVADLQALASALQLSAGAVGDALGDARSPVLAWTLDDAAPHDPAGVRAARAELDAVIGALRWIDGEVAALTMHVVAAAAAYEQTEQHVGSSLVGDLVNALWGAPAMLPTPLIAHALQVPVADVTPEFLLPRVLAPLLPDGSPVVHDLGADPEGTIAPRALSDLVLDLARRDQGRAGEISVSFVTGSDGRRRAIVDLPGTKSWDPAPVADVTSVGTDVIAIAGHSTSYEQGVFAALDDAGVGPDTDVMLVGHSEGGIVAVDAARDAARSGRFRITHVVTAGSPVGALASGLPSTVQLLSLENTADLVPALDSAPNPDLPNVVTVRANEQHGSIGANHDLDTSYEPEAVQAQTAGSGSVDAFLRGAHGFLSGDSMSTHAYQITRRP